MATRILIVEDEIERIHALTSILEERGYAVAAARSAEGAIPLLDTFRPDVVLIDSVLPEESGTALTSILRTSRHYRHLRVIAMSGADQPFRIEDVCELLERLVRGVV